MTNEWCKVLGITPPQLDAVADHPEANTYALLLVALLERGAAMTLAEVAARFEAAGIAEFSRARLSLQRCKPGRPPVYRDGDLYRLDPHDDELDLWAFRLGLRPPKVVQPPAQVAETEPLPDPETALSTRELDEAWADASLRNWSLQRLAVAVLDAHGGPLPPRDVVAAVTARTEQHAFQEHRARFEQRGSAVDVLADGRWAIAPDADAIVKQARQAVRERIVVARRHAAQRTAPEVLEEQHADRASRRAARGAELGRLKRALLATFPPSRPVVAALVDVGEHQLTSFVGDEIAALPSRLVTYDILGGVDVAATLRALGFDPGDRRLAELGPPQKTKRLNQSGRTLKITTALLVQGSCGISTPFGDPNKLAEYVAKGDLTRLRRRIEADVKSLHALYEYGRLHGGMRLRWGFLDEWIPAPWVHRDELRLFDLQRSALAKNEPLEIVVGRAPAWSEPWMRMCRARVRQDANGWRMWLVDEEGLPIDETEVQRARLPVAPG